VNYDQDPNYTWDPDQALCFDNARNAVDASLCNERCDSTLDHKYRTMVDNMEQFAKTNSLVSECAIWYNIQDLNDLLNSVTAQYPNTSTPDGYAKGVAAVQRIYAARKIVPLSEILTQKISSITNQPEWDDPSTEVDESKNCKDDDGDGEVDDKGYDWSNYEYQVSYGYCSDIYAGYSNPRCQRWDTGMDFLESTEQHIMRYDRDYVFDHFRRDRSPPWGSGRAYMARLEARRFIHMTNVFRYYLYTRRSAFEAPLYDNWKKAAFKGLNFLERVLQTPEPGHYCLNTARQVYELDPSGEAANCTQPIDIGLGYGAGKYINTAWTNEYYYKPNRIGAYYDKLAALRQLTSSSGYFVRDVADLFDRRAFSLGYMRVFDDPFIQRFSALIQGDNTGYLSAVTTDEQGTAIRYMPFFDEQFDYGSCTKETESEVCTIAGTKCNAAPGQTGTCVGGSVRQSLEQLPKIEPAWSWSLQFLSLLYAEANLSSINDYAPEFYRFLKIAIKGTPEDIDYGPEIDIVEFTDPETRITYRAPVIPKVSPAGFVLPFPSYYGDPFHTSRGQYRDWGIGADLIKRAQAYYNDVWLPRSASCPDITANTAACSTFRDARRELSEMVGYIDIIRRFNRAAEFN
jgi:hypothetical protein